MELYERGVGQLEIARRLGLAKSTVAYHVRGLGVDPDPRFNRRYDWSAVQAYYDAGHSVRDCVAHFGFNHGTWHAAVARGAVVARPATMSIDELLSGRKRNRNHVKSRLIKAGLKGEHCEACGRDEWRGRPIALQLHHINGDGDDNRLTNLQLLCGNCHSQTETWGGKNRGRRRPGSDSLDPAE